MGNKHFTISDNGQRYTWHDKKGNTITYSGPIVDADNSAPPRCPSAHTATKTATPSPYYGKGEIGQLVVSDSAVVEILGEFACCIDNAIQFNGVPAFVPLPLSIFVSAYDADVAALYFNFDVFYFGLVLACCVGGVAA
jgi:hypothetical protein